jgi:DNA gyrase subunit A
MLSIVNGQPRELGLADVLKRFIDHRIDVVRRRTDYLLRKAREREHILLGFKKAIENLDAVIKLIRASTSPREARDGLIRTFEFTERQAQAIIELQLQRLTGMEIEKILKELAEIQVEIAEYLEILASDKKLRGIVVQELKEVQKEFGDERRTQIIEDTGEIHLEDLIQVEDVAVTVTHGGYLKRTAVDTYRRQSRGGKGRIGMGTRTEDVVEHLVVASTHAYLLVFTTKGRVFWLKIYEIPDAGTTGRGKHVSGLVNLQVDEAVKTFLPVKDFVPNQYIVMVTKQGVIKKCELTEFDNPMSRGIIALSLDEGDELLAARLTNGENYIFLGTREGKAIRFREDDVRAMGRPARGVRAMDLGDGDTIIGAEVVEKEGLILSISENGFGKRTPLEDYRLTSRGGKGVINMKLAPRIGKVVAILSVKEDTDLMIITRDGKIIRLESGEIRQAGRSTQGVRLVRMEEGDQVAAASVIPTVIPDEGEGQNDLPLQ